MKRLLQNRLREYIKGVVSFDEQLKRHTTFKIGGVPEVWVEPASVEDLRCALEIIAKAGLKPFVIGNGSNLLISDGKIDLAIIRLASAYFKKLRFNGDSVVCGAGCGLSRLIVKCIDKGLAGLEGLAGIPGTLGGALAMNAGTDRENSIARVVEWVKVIDYKDRRVSVIKKDRLKFTYRNSNLTRYIILEACLALKRSRPSVVRESYNRLLKRRFKTQEYRYPSAGCIFKNPADSRLTSGQMLDRCGLKGKGINDACVSAKHANFIINKDRARFDDVIALIEMEQDIVKKRYGIWLEPEITIIR